MNNSALYDAIMAGGTGGTLCRWITSKSSVSYDEPADAIEAFAVAIDAAIPTIVDGPSISEINLLQSLIQGVVTDRNLISMNLSDYADIAAAIATAFEETRTRLNNVPAVGGSAGGSTLSTTLYVDAATIVELANQTGAIGAPFASVQQAISIIEAGENNSVWVVLVVPSLSIEDVIVPPARLISLQAIGVDPTLTSLNSIIWALGAIEAPASLTLSGLSVKSISFTGTIDENNARTLSLISCNVGESNVETLGINGIGINVDVIIDSYLQYTTWVEGISIDGKLTSSRTKFFGPITAAENVILDAVKISTGGRTDGNKTTITKPHGRLTARNVLFPFQGIIDFNGGGNTRLLEDDETAQGRLSGGITATGLVYMNNLSGAMIFIDTTVPSISEGECVDIEMNGMFGGSGFELLKSCWATFGSPPFSPNLVILGAWVSNAATGGFKIRVGAFGANVIGQNQEFHFYFRPG
jgi:hypothetical protein